MRIDYVIYLLPQPASTLCPSRNLPAINRGIDPAPQDLGAKNVRNPVRKLVGFLDMLAQISGRIFGKVVETICQARDYIVRSLLPTWIYTQVYI